MCLDSSWGIIVLSEVKLTCHTHYVHVASISGPISNEMWSIFHRSIDIVSFNSCCAANMQSTPLLTKRSQEFLHNVECGMIEQRMCWSNRFCHFSNEMPLYPITHCLFWSQFTNDVNFTIIANMKQCRCRHICASLPLEEVWIRCGMIYLLTNDVLYNRCYYSDR